MKVKLSTGQEMYIDFYVKRKKDWKGMSKKQIQKEKKKEPEWIRYEKPNTTVCIISNANCGVVKQDEAGNSQREPMILGKGSSRCHKKDKYNKALGKTKALQRALEDMCPASCIEFDKEGSFKETIDPQRKKIRTEIWSIFFKALQTPDKTKLAGIEKWEITEKTESNSIKKTTTPSTTA